MGCRVGNRSSHRRSFRARNEPPGWENTDRPVMRSKLCNILAASSGRRGGCGPPVTNHFEGIGVVLGTQLTRRNLYHRVGNSKSRILNSISSVRFRSRFHIPFSRDLAARTSHPPPRAAPVTNLLCRAQAERTMQARVRSGIPVHDVARPRAPEVSAFVIVAS